MKDHKKSFNFFSKLQYDLPASIVVFLVAMPLCLGIALASGAPLFSGIIAGIVGGIVVSLLSGSPLGVSGPAAGLAVIVLTAISDLGSFEIFLTAVVVAGIIQIILGILKAGIIGYYFPSSVIKGMLSAIGIIIFLKQIPHAFGYDRDYEGDIAFTQGDGENTFSELLNMLNYLSPGAIIISIVSLGILILFEQSFIKKVKVFQWIQGPLLVVIIGIFLGLVFENIESLSLNTDQLVQIPVASNFNDFIGQFTLPDFSYITNSDVLITAFTMAIVASLETLLCVEATDKLDPYKRITPPNRELFAQGTGNIISGLIGGLPITQVIVRSSANIQSGGKTKASAFFHGILLLLTAVLIPNVINLIPYASLAAILLVVGYKLAKPSIFKAMYALGRKQFIPFLVTILAIVFTDLLVGIGIGLAVAIFYILFTNYKTPYFFNEENIKEGEPIHIKLSENVTFLNKARIINILDKVPEYSNVIIDASRSVYIHSDILEIFSDFKENASARSIKLEFVGFNDKDFKFITQ